MLTAEPETQIREGESEVLNENEEREKRDEDDGILTPGGEVSAIDAMSNGYTSTATWNLYIYRQGNEFSP